MGQCYAGILRIDFLVSSLRSRYLQRNTSSASPDRRAAHMIWMVISAVSD